MSAKEMAEMHSEPVLGPTAIEVQEAWLVRLPMAVLLLLSQLIKQGQQIQAGIDEPLAWRFLVPLQDSRFYKSEQLNQSIWLPLQVPFQ